MSHTVQGEHHPKAGNAGEIRPADGAGSENPPSRFAAAGGSVVRALSHTGASLARDVAGVLNETLAPYDVHAQVDERGTIMRVPPHQVIWTTMLARALTCVVGVLVLVGVALLAPPKEGVAALIAGAIPFIFTGFALIAGGIKAANSNLNFSVAVTADGLLVTRGVTTTLRRVIGLDRIQAVELQQPLMWRPMGLWRVRFTVAGAGGAKDQPSEDVLCPAGTMEQIMALLGLVLPQPGLPAEISPREVVLDAMYGQRGKPGGLVADGIFLGQPRSARILDPVTFARKGFVCTDTMVIIRGGRLRRTVTFVPHARVQSLEWSQGPLQRWRGVATVALHPASGPISPELPHLQGSEAHEFFISHSHRTQAARRELDAAA